MKLIILHLLIALLLLGCDSQAKNPKPKGEKESLHHHSHDPRYGGYLVAVGDHFAHIEVVVEEGKMALYILDGEAQGTLRSQQENILIDLVVNEETKKLSLKGVANKLTGETAKDTSQFEVIDKSLQKAAEYKVVVQSITIKGKELKNVVIEKKNSHDDHDHDDHDHDHDDHDHDHDDHDHDHDDHDH